GGRGAADQRRPPTRRSRRRAAAGKGTMTVAVLSGRYDRLVWGAVAIAAALLFSRIVRLVVPRLEAQRPAEERELVRLRRGETARVPPLFDRAAHGGPRGGAPGDRRGRSACARRPGEVPPAAARGRGAGARRGNVARSRSRRRRADDGMARGGVARRRAQGAAAR